MPDRPLPGEPATPVQPPEPGELVSSVTSLFNSKPQAVATLFRAFVQVVGPGAAGGRRLFSIDALRLVVALDQRRSDQSHGRQLALIASGLAGLLVVTTALLVLVYLLRDRVELVKAVLAGVALLVSHGACTAGGYVAGRGHRKPRR